MTPYIPFIGPLGDSKRNKINIVEFKASIELYPKLPPLGSSIQLFIMDSFGELQAFCFDTKINMHLGRPKCHIGPVMYFSSVDFTSFRAAYPG